VDDLRKIYSKIYLVRNEREFHLYSFDDGERFEPDYVLFLQKKKEDGYEQMQIFIEPKGTHLLEKDAWKERFLLQMKDEAIPVKIFMDDNNYKIWGFHFFNQDQRMTEFDLEFTNLIDAQEKQKQRIVKYNSTIQENTDSYERKIVEGTIEYEKKE